MWSGIIFFLYCAIMCNILQRDIVSNLASFRVIPQRLVVGILDFIVCRETEPNDPLSQWLAVYTCYCVLNRHLLSRLFGLEQNFPLNDSVFVPLLFQSQPGAT